MIEKFGSLSSSSPGGPTPTSPASTGSVGASAAASTIAAPSDRPMTCVPKTATATIVSGIAINSNRPTPLQAAGSSSRSSFSPVPNNATITANSAARS